MKFSIIIPAHNAENTLRQCLDAVFSSENKDFETILVDDGSTDRSASVAKSYSCTLITLNKNSGTAAARNIGKENARGEILVFIDADVMIKKDTLGIIEKTFAEDGDSVAVTGVLSKESPHKDFFSQYKNLYMHYIFKKCPRSIDFLFGSIVAIRKKYFLPFDDTFKITDDTELGQRYKERGKRILLPQELEVTHLKKYNLKSIIINDFSVPFWWVKSFILHNGLRDIFTKRRFSHARINQIAGLFVSYVILASLIFSYHPAMRIMLFISLFTFLFLQYEYFIFFYREKGFFYMIKSVFFAYCDMLIMGLGIMAGTAFYRKNKR